jgi:hypothetical protein
MHELIQSRLSASREQRLREFLESQPRIRTISHLLIRLNKPVEIPYEGKAHSIGIIHTTEGRSYDLIITTPGSSGSVWQRVPLRRAREVVMEGDGFERQGGIVKIEQI